MSYTYDQSDTNTLMKEGDYEATIEKIERKTLPSGKEKLAVTYRIRTDVEQEYKNKCMFEDIWAEKANPEIFNRKRINQLLGTQNIKDGTTFETINDVIKFLLGGNLIIHISVEFDDYHGEDKNVVSYYKSSKHKDKVIGEEGVNKTEKIEISDDDLPF